VGHRCGHKRNDRAASARLSTFHPCSFPELVGITNSSFAAQHTVGVFVLDAQTRDAFVIIGGDLSRLHYVRVEKKK
jgi:hypothetical protein